jgi:hypothetical protein
MITIEKTTEITKAYGKGIEIAKVDKRGFVHAKLPNPIDPSSPLTLILHPIEETLTFRVIVPVLGRVRDGSPLNAILMSLNSALDFGCIVTDPRDGDISFVINLPCRDGAEVDPDPEILSRLLDTTCETVKTASRIILRVQLREAGVPEEVAANIIKTHFPNEDEGTEEETL